MNLFTWLLSKENAVIKMDAIADSKNKNVSFG